MSIERRQRRRHDGTVYDVWRVRFTDAAGLRCSRTFDSREDAADFEAHLRLLKRRGELASLDAGRQTLAEFVAEWWELEATPNLERATLKSYASHWNRHALPRLGHLELRQVTPQVVVAFRVSLERGGVGVEAIRRTMTMLQGIFARAVEWQRVSANPFKAVRKPRSKHRVAVAPLAPGTVELMREHLLARGGQRDATLLSVLAYAGLRPEEALALRWRHVRQRTLLVEAALADGQLKDQKNRRPPRTVELLGPLREDLAGWRRQSGEPSPDRLVFPNGRGAAWRDHDYRNWRRRVYQPTARALSLATTRPYDLRHAFASLMLHEGRLSIVELAHQLGHSPTMTLNTYGHVIAELKGGPRRSAEDQIRRARKAVNPAEPPTVEELPRNVIAFPVPPRSAPKTPPQRLSDEPEGAATPLPQPKPSIGLEPMTPSLPWKCSTN